MTDFLVSIVTRNDERFLKRCLESVQGQSVPCRIRIFDNDSSDNTCEVARHFSVELQRSRRNLGYSRGHNQNLKNGRFSFALLLNADTVLQPRFVERLSETCAPQNRIGFAGGKLLRMTAQGEPEERDGQPVLDSTGMYFTPTQRHFDRGSGKVDQAQFELRQEVFGISGAALFLSRPMFEDLQVEGEFLDEDFFAYREDADLAWRARLAGWKAIYEPRAQALHYRRLRESRRATDPLINYHSVKNRYLMRLKNLDWAVHLRCLPFMWARDAGILLYVLLRERESLAAFGSLKRHFRRALQKRRIIQKRRRIRPVEMARWFAFTPRAINLESCRKGLGRENSRL